MPWRSETYFQLSELLTALGEDQETLKLLQKLRTEAGAEHITYGYGCGCDGRLVYPVLSTLPDEFRRDYATSESDRADSLVQSLRRVPRDIDLTQQAEREALGVDLEIYKQIDKRFEVPLPTSTHGFVGAFGEIAGVTFYGGKTSTSLTIAGQRPISMFERRCRLARQLHIEIGKRWPHHWLRSGLSNREATCLHLTASGLGAAQIGAILGVSKRTIEDHLAAARRRLGTRNGAATLALAVHRGFIRPINAPARQIPSDNASV